MRIIHRETVGQITDVERLRSVFLSVSKSLERLATVAPIEAFWTEDYLLKLHDSLDIGWQSLPLLELTFSRLESELVEKTCILAAAAAAAEASANEATVAKQVANSNAVATRASAGASLALCKSFLRTYRTNMTALDDMKRVTKNKPSADARGEGEISRPVSKLHQKRRGYSSHHKDRFQSLP